MRSTLVAILLALALLLPTTIARPRDVQADCLEADIPVAIITLGIVHLANGGDSLCQSFGETPPEDPRRGCLIGDVGATAKIDANGLSYRYDYRLANECGDVKVQAGYAFKGGEVSERLEGNGTTVRATWYCSDNPWTYAPGERPSCSRDAINVTGPNADAKALEASKLTYPMSAGVLAPISREILNGQGENAKKQEEAKAARTSSQPASGPTPTPKPLVATGRPVNADTAPIIYPAQELRVGATGPQMEAVQHLLRHRGQNVPVTGVFDAATTNAILALQRAEKVNDNGRLVGATWVLLLKPVERGDQGEAVIAMQKLLNAQGQDVFVDGDFGEQTEGSLRAFQTDAGIDVTGEVNQQTWRALLFKQ